MRTHLNRRAGSCFAGVLVLAATACSDSPTGSGKSTPPSTAPVLSSAENLTPGQTARLVGQNLSGASALTVDGQAVSFQAVSATEIQFVLPALRACETDGRPIAIQVAKGAETATRQFPIAITDTVAMGLGESRVLSAADLANGTCLRFGANGQEYVVSTLNTWIPEQYVAVKLDTLVGLRTWTGSSAPAASVSPVFSRSAGNDAHVAQHAAMYSEAMATSPYYTYVDKPILFDPAYANPVVGGVAKFVDWREIKRQNLTCDADRSTAPSYQVEVLAMAGNTVIAVDLRRTDVATFRNQKAWFQNLAERVERVLMPTMHLTFSASYSPPAGPNGRHWHLLTVNDAGMGAAGVSTDGATWESQLNCALASQTITPIYNSSSVARWGFSEGASRFWASAMIHEYAHNADILVSRRSGAMDSFAGNSPQMESWAVVAEDVAARLSAGRSFDLNAVSTSPLVYNPTLVRGALWGRDSHLNPWTGNGKYNIGGPLYAFAREQAGMAETTDFALRPQTFFEKLGDSKTFDLSAQEQLDRLAVATGIAGPVLLDRFALASATDDRIDPAAAQAAGLPQIAGWTTTEQDFAPSLVASRTQNAAYLLAAAPSNYAALYLVPEAGRGISLEVTQAPHANALIRLTRVK